MTFWWRAADLAATWLDVLSRETGTRRRLLRGGGNVPARLHTHSGHLVYADADALFAVPVDQRFEPVGPPAPVMSGIDHYFSAFERRAVRQRHRRLRPSRPRPRGGTRLAQPRGERHSRDGRPSAICHPLPCRPDGREAAGALVEGTKSQVWIFDLERGAKRLLVAEGESRQPIWSRDGAFITYVSDRGDEQAFCRKRADGTGAVEVLMRRPRGYSRPEDWSPDGRIAPVQRVHESR